MVTVANIIWGPAIAESYAADSLSTYNLNDADNSVALEVTAPKNGTINEIGLYIDTIIGNPPAYNLGLVTVSGGYPTSTAYGGSASISIDFTTTGWKWESLVTPATAAIGDLFAIRIWPGTTPDISNYIRVLADNILYLGFPQGWKYATSWFYANGPIQLACKYDDGTIVGYPVTVVNGSYFDNTSDPDEIGNKFTVPMDVKCNGVRFQFQDAYANAPVDVVLYDSGSSVLATASLESLGSTSNYYGIVDLFFDAEVQLTANQIYRVAVKPASSLGIELHILGFPSATERVCSIPESNHWYKTYRTDGGSWTDDQASLTWMALILSEITVSGGSGPGAGSSEWGYVG